MENKIVIVGEGGCGKTNILRKIMGFNFEKKYIATIGVEVHEFEDKEFWDTAGHEKFAGLKEGYYIGAGKAILVFDLTSRVSFRKLGSYYRNLVNINNNIEILLVGSKNDLPNQKVTDDMVEVFISDKPNIVSYEKMSCEEAPDHVDR